MTCGENEPVNSLVAYVKSISKPTAKLAVPTGFMNCIRYHTKLDAAKTVVFVLTFKKKNMMKTKNAP